MPMNTSPILSGDFAVTNVSNLPDDAVLDLNGSYDSTSAVINGTTYLFVTAQGDRAISVFSVSNDGTLTSVDSITEDGPLGVLNLDLARGVETVEVNGTTYLYVSGLADDGLSIFSVANDGTLTNIQNIGDDATLALDSPNHISTAEVGGTNYIFVSAIGDSGISVYSVGNDGMLTNVDNVSDDATTLLAATYSTTTAVVNGTTYLFSASFSDNGVSVFSVANDGTLTNVANVADDATLQLDEATIVHTAVVDGTTYLFASGREDGISVFSVANDGTLTNVDNVSDDGTLELGNVFSLDTVEIGGVTYLFATGQSDSGISAFSVAANGTLTNVGNISDDGTLLLDNVVSATIVEINGSTYLMTAAVRDGGVSVFQISSGFGGSGVEFTEDGPAVVLDADGTISDEELDIANNGDGEYNGASITLSRSGGANAEDAFGFASMTNVAVAGSTLTAGGNVIANFTNTGGQLMITFTNANGTTPTSAFVDEIIQAFTYSNSSDTPPATVQIDVVFDDGSGEMNSSTTGSVTVNITTSDDAPTVDINTGVTIFDGTDTEIGTAELHIMDIDTGDANLTFTLDQAVANGTLYLDNDGSNTFNAGDTELGAGGTFTQEDINNGALRYVHDGTNTVLDSFQFDVTDGSSPISDQTFTIGVIPLVGSPTENDDILNGTSGNDIINGLGGNDNISALDGDDSIFASAGFDIIDGGVGTDTFVLSSLPASTLNWVNLEATSAQFRVNDGTGFASRANLSGIENVRDSSGSDAFYGNVANNTYFYTSGLDTFDGNGGFDTFDFSAMEQGFQWIDLEASSSQLRSNDGSGWVANATILDVENFITTDDTDHFRGDGGDQTIRYMGGRDFIDGRVGSDTLDMSNFGSGNWVNLNIAADQLRYFNGAGWASGGNMQNVENVIGGDGNDFFYADGADNFYFGGLGNDRFEGGAGTDTFQVDGVLGDYTLSESGGSYTMSGISGTDTLIDVEQVEIGGTLYDIAALDALI